MPSIAMFFSRHTIEEKILSNLVNLSHYAVIKDKDIIEDAASKFGVPEEKLAKSLYRKTSVFNKFTLERELNTARLKAALADKLVKSNQILYGFTSLLIPKDITHIVRTLIVDEKPQRVENIAKNGMTRKEAEKEVRKADISAYHWAEFIADCEPWDKKLYDIVVPVDQKRPEEIATFILEKCAQGSLLETAESAQAIQNMKLAAQVEISLLKMGQKVSVEANKGDITLQVNRSVLNFSALSHELTEHVQTIAGVNSTKISMGRDYSDSIYRDQEFKLPPKVLLVDDEKEFALTLSERLISRNVGSYAVYDGQEALNFITEDQPDVMVLDLKMPGVSGMEVLEQTKKDNPNIEIIILTGHGTEEDRINCLKLGAFAYLQKPTDIHTLSDTIHQAHQKGTDKRLAA